MPSRNSKNAPPAVQTKVKESNLLSYKEIDERITKSKQVYIPDAIDELLNNTSNDFLTKFLLKFSW